MQQAAPLQETVQQAQTLNQQREQQLALEAQQRQQEGPGGRGPAGQGLTLRESSVRLLGDVCCRQRRQYAIRE
ncbi:hypothetical protein E4A48_13120 [Xanthomonas cerealis pv. cerealis]|uniref:Uncharacterized protein n=1 Tax=Xanthomonas cerealis pv. cerealis TaxID=152263 RepID=A0A514EER8_9XANT|nr:hypothetical protein [Xanthomonas translucens]QDI04502.1 hypothetical protein E4A48_13120 [Xanthomonas translucens pv. cerealis]